MFRIALAKTLINNYPSPGTCHSIGQSDLYNADYYCSHFDITALKSLQLKQKIRSVYILNYHNLPHKLFSAINNTFCSTVECYTQISCLDGSV